MATTTNYSWTTPDDTGLVKDGASAIRTLGSSVDTTLKNLNPSTTLGDIEYRSSSANVNTRLGIGTSGQVLAVSGGVPAWTNVATGGMTLLSTTTLSGSTTTIGSINQNYNNLQLWIYGVDISGQAALNYEMTGKGNICTYNYINNATVGSVQNRDGVYCLGNSGDESLDPDSLDLVINIYNYASSVNKNFDAVGKFIDYSTGQDRALWQGGTWKTVDPVTSLDFYMTGGPSFNAGTVKIYGVK